MTNPAAHDLTLDQEASRILREAADLLERTGLCDGHMVKLPDNSLGPRQQSWRDGVILADGLAFCGRGAIYAVAKEPPYLDRYEYSKPTERARDAIDFSVRKYQRPVSGARNLIDWVDNCRASGSQVIAMMRLTAEMIDQGAI